MKGRQILRFRTLTRFVDLAQITSVLDVGCGFGDFYDFLRSHGCQARYVGIDFIEELIKVGQRVYPDADLRTMTPSEFPENESFDLVLGCGIFNAPHATEELTRHHIENTLREMFRRAKLAVTADFISAYVDHRDEHVHYRLPEHVFQTANQLTKRVILAHNYQPFELAVCLYCDDDLT